MIPGAFHIGTSGWSYKHWSGIFYPENMKPDKYLEYYSTRYHCVELNSSFYHLPLKTTIAGWIKRTPVSFKFCPKMSRFITHQLQLANIEEALGKFFDVFEEMKEKLGPVLVQLPPGLPYDKSRVSNFLEIIRNLYGQYRFAVEVRHKSWINDEFFDQLSHYGTAFVIADSGKRFPYYEAVTADFVYLRFHGRDHLYASDYSENDLRPYAEKISHWLHENKKVWAFFNNDFHGFAVRDANIFRELVNGTVRMNP